MISIKIKKNVVNKPLKRLLKISGYIILILFSLEIAIRIASFFYPHQYEPEKNQNKIYNYTILTIGDSFTYGVLLDDRNDTYPKQLEYLLNGKTDTLMYRVINEGVPGINSQLISNRFEDNLQKYEPDLIILLVGVNNVWNNAGEDLPSWLYKSRVYMFYRLLRSYIFNRYLYFLKNLFEAIEASNVAKEKWIMYQKISAYSKINPTLDGKSEKEIVRSQTKLGQDLIKVIEKSRVYNKRLILLTYPSCVLQWDDVIRKVSEEHSTELVDLCDRFSRLSREELFFKDGHPNKKGNRIMAEEIFKRITARN